MNIVLFTHPMRMSSNSMPRYAGWLEAGLAERGHTVSRLTAPGHLAAQLPARWQSKWVNYVDQFVLFPLWVRPRLRRLPADTLFVFCDQALGPWVPLVCRRPHVVHCHDFLALRSALGEIPENPTSFTGRLYQRLIRWGFRHGRHFISISRQTQADLQRFGPAQPLTSEVVLNGLNFPYAPLSADAARQLLHATPLQPGRGFLLNVAGSQWYKNRAGIVRLYAEYVRRVADPLPLWCVGPPPDAAVRAQLAQVGPAGAVHFVQGLSSPALQAAYSLAAAFLFPSLEEGFGWPIIEAQACGCPVLTTDAPPMNEVAGPAAVLLPRLAFGGDLAAWAVHSADQLVALLAEPPAQRQTRAEQGLAWAARFDAERALDACAALYEQVLAQSAGPAAPPPKVSL